jgi:hypothetical protein
MKHALDGQQTFIEMWKFLWNTIVKSFLAFCAIASKENTFKRKVTIEEEPQQVSEFPTNGRFAYLDFYQL